MTRRCAAVGVALVALALGLPQQADAQACCSSGSDEFGLVQPCYDAVIGAQLSWDRAYGGYDADDRFHVLDGAEVDDVVMTLAGGVRFVDRKLSLSASLPTRLQYRGFDAGGSSARFGLGDVGASFRWTVVSNLQSGLQPDNLESYLPFIDLFVGGRAPTGRAPEDTQDGIGADITGDGAWALSFGAKVTKFLTADHAITTSATYMHRFARDIAGLHFAPGPEVLLRASWIFIPNIWWSGGAFTSLSWSGAAAEDGVTVPDGGSHRWRLGGFLTHAFHYPEWDATVSVAFDPPIDYAGANVPFAGTTLSVAVRRNFL